MPERTLEQLRAQERELRQKDEGLGAEFDKLGVRREERLEEIEVERKKKAGDPEPIQESPLQPVTLLEEVKLRDYPKCPSCQEIIFDSSATRCPVCDWPLNESPQDTPPIPTPVAETTRPEEHPADTEAKRLLADIEQQPSPTPVIPSAEVTPELARLQEFEHVVQLCKNVLDEIEKKVDDYKNGRAKKFEATLAIKWATNELEDLGKRFKSFSDLEGYKKIQEELEQRVNTVYREWEKVARVESTGESPAPQQQPPEPAQTPRPPAPPAPPQPPAPSEAGTVTRTTSEQLVDLLGDWIRITYKKLASLDPETLALTKKLVRKRLKELRRAQGSKPLIEGTEENCQRILSQIKEIENKRSLDGYTAEELDVVGTLNPPNTNKGLEKLLGTWSSANYVNLPPLSEETRGELRTLVQERQAEGAKTPVAVVKNKRVENYEEVIKNQENAIKDYETIKESLEAKKKEAWFKGKYTTQIQEIDNIIKGYQRVITEMEEKIEEEKRQEVLEKIEKRILEIKQELERRAAERKNSL